MQNKNCALVIAGLALLGSSICAADNQWVGDLSAIDGDAWSTTTASHLLERAGFGGTPAEIGELAELGPGQAVKRMVYFKGVSREWDPPFEHSGVFDEGLDPFPPSRPATTAQSPAPT